VSTVLVAVDLALPVAGKASAANSNGALAEPDQVFLIRPPVNNSIRRGTTLQTTQPKLP
jgi:hypothetical protein